MIRKFLDAQRIHNLTAYLQTLHRQSLANADHTTLLLNCYTKLKDSSKLEEFIKVWSGAGGLQGFVLSQEDRWCRGQGDMGWSFLGQGPGVYELQRQVAFCCFSSSSPLSLPFGLGVTPDSALGIMQNQSRTQVTCIILCHPSSLVLELVVLS